MLKKIVSPLIVALILITFGCNQSKRKSTQEDTSSGSFTFPTSTTTGETTGGGSEEGSENGLGAGFEDCDLDNTLSEDPIGTFGICQSSSTETVFIVVFGQDNSSERTCFLPMYRDSQGSSTYLGTHICTFQTSGQKLQGTFVKNRPGFQGLSLNGTMVMQESRVQAFYACMEAPPLYREIYCAPFVDQGGYKDVAF